MRIGPSSAVDARLGGWAVVVLVAVSVIGFPLFDLVREVVASGSAAFDALGDSLAPIAATAWTSLAATAMTLVLATSVAVAVAGARPGVRLAVAAVMAAPLLVPPFVSSLSWVAAYGPGGLSDDLLGISLPGLIGPFGVVALLVVSAVPIAYLVVAASLEARRERDLVRAAQVSGATAWEAFRSVTLPLLRPALVGAGAISFIMSANAFGVPAVLGTPAGFGTVTTRIYRDLVLSADPAAFDRVLLLAAVLALGTLGVVAAADRKGRDAARKRAEASGPRVGDRRIRSTAVAAIALHAAATMVIPFVALVLTSLTPAVGVSSVPSVWTLDHYAAALRAGAAGAFGTSLVLATAAASVTVALGALLVALERRRRSGASTTVALGFAVPGSALAVAVLLAWGPWLRDTLLIVLVAYVAKFWALGHRPIAGAADGISPELFDAARVAGASPPTATRTVTLPLLVPSVVAAWLVVAVFALHELTMSSLLHGPGTATVAVAVLDLQQLGDPTVTSAMAALLTLAVIAAAVPLLWVLRPMRSSR